MISIVTVQWGMRNQLILFFPAGYKDSAKL